MKTMTKEHSAPGSPLVLGDGGGGWRQYLDGNPIHCGATLELAEKEWRGTGDSETLVFTGRFVSVRYEVAWLTSREGRTVRVPMMYKSVAGYNFSAPIEDHHCFRWPEDKRYR